ncbi:type VI secretion system tip protein TssI/VgrG [Mangrovibacter phragmitis]|uniref:type VI secretion system Vgr family protein n=1 Tax=Mangrovibacter phragmitis TaxID=1691903 RepID=UPI00336A4B24
MSLLDQPKRSQQQHLLSWNGAIADALLLVSLQGEEALSSPYCYLLRSMTRQTEEQIAQWHGQAVSCRIGEENMPGPVRYVHGVVTRIQYARQGKDEAECIFTLEPALAPLKLGRVMRVWQNISVPDLVSELLRTHGINELEMQLHGSYPEREYCIQYRESAFDFIQRLLEEEGIYYFFRHSESGHQLILADHPASHVAISGRSLAWHDAGRLLSGGVIDSWVSEASLLPGRVEYHGFSMPQAAAIDVGHSAGKQGTKLDDVVFTDITPAGERGVITRHAEHAMAAREANVLKYQATSAVHWLSSGETFTLTDHPSGEREYRVQALTLDIANHSDGKTSHCHCKFEAMSNDSPWAPPVKYSPREIPGVLLATVVGPASEEIHTDEYGRIKIQFPWDQENPADDTSSCWVQVAQSWVGGKFGAQFIPRVGSEVLVSFVQGHPDHPVVTGSVYNGQNKPPFALPDEKNESGFMTRSATGGSVDDGHRLSFNDKKGEERLTIVAQKDLELTVKNEVKNTIAANRFTELTKGNDQLVLRQGDMKLVLEKGNWQQSITGNMATELKNGDYALKVAGGGQVKTDKALSLESTQSIELKVGANKITLSASGISINGATLKLQASSTAEMKGAILKLEGSGTAELKGAMATVSGSGMARVSGGITNIG